LAAAVLFLTAAPSIAGWIEDRDGRTVIHVKLFDLPDPADHSPANRADVAAVRLFK
jgi:hypothetical protein